MSCIKGVFSVYGPSDLDINFRGKGDFRVCSSIGGLQFKESNLEEISGKSLYFSDQKGLSSLSFTAPNLDHVQAQSTISFPKSVKWWEKSMQPNMVEINSAQEFVDSLMNAADQLVIVDFFSPGCGGCRALHRKICQLAESNPNAIFLTVNYEQHKAMCYALHVHVLPFFRFYRGADGRLCSFSCTNATINKFRDALAKHGTERCSLGPTKGLDEKELLALASIDLISGDLVPNSGEGEEVEDFVAKSNAVSIDERKIGVKEGNAMVTT